MRSPASTSYDIGGFAVAKGVTVHLVSSCIHRTGFVILLVLFLALPHKRLEYTLVWRKHDSDRSLPAAKMVASLYFNTSVTQRLYCRAKAPWK